MICAKQVFRCFKWLERAGDTLTGAAGPLFIFLAVVFISVGALCFFDVILPTLPWPWITTPICILIAFNMFAHYYFVCTVPPGFVDDPPRPKGSGWMWAKQKKSAQSRELTGVRWSDDVNVTRAGVSQCRRCGLMRPERSHHCRICKRCVLKYDHHCPVVRDRRKIAVGRILKLCSIAGVNQCVGLHNERHFVLFLVYLSISTLLYSVCGWRHVLIALGWYSEQPWEHRSPEIAFLLGYILSVVMSFAVSIMTSFHVWGIAGGETSVESQDHEHYRQIAKKRGEKFINSFDLGKRRNLEVFFNIGNNGYPIYTLFVPLRIEPYTDGHSWARRKGLQTHIGVPIGEELTDEEE